MIAVKGRRKCANCGKRYNYTYAKGEEASRKVKFKGKEENLSTVTKVTVLSMHTYEAVSYTHLDVYKRQVTLFAQHSWARKEP